MSSNSFFSKVKRKVNELFIQRYVDEKYWQLVDATGQPGVVTLYKEERLDDLKEANPKLDLDAERMKGSESFLFDLHKYTKYLYQVSDCIVEPKYNWVIMPGNKLFKYSWPYIQDPWVGSKPKPSVAGFLLKLKPIELEEAILVKYLWNNYYHFLFDVLTQLKVYDDLGIPLTVPVIVPEGSMNFSYVQAYEKLFSFGRKIIVQDIKTYYKVAKLYVGKDSFLSDGLLQIKKRFISFPALAKVATATPEKLFLTRGINNRRAMINIGKIEAIARAEGFTVVETGGLSLAEQIKLMSNASHVIAIHGAALGNLMYCKPTGVTLLEIFPGDNFKPQLYRFVCEKFGYGYLSILGAGAAKADGRFVLDPAVFFPALEQLLNKSL